MEYFSELKSTKIFQDSSESDCQAMMFCFKTKFKTYEKNEKIVNQGDPMQHIILIISGSANVENIDTFGNISIVLELNQGDAYGIESAYLDNETYSDSLVANEKTFVMFLDKHRLTNPCENRCKRHTIVLKNLMIMLAERNIQLAEKLSHMSKKTIRDKLLSYFETLAKTSGNNYFDIPFTKTELASYLSVDRSAMSSELSKMKKENIIDFDKKHFRLIKTAHEK